MPKIIVQKGAEIVKTYNLPSREEITIGCSTGCDVPIEDPALASELAKLVLKEDGFHLQLITHIPPVFVTGERVEGDVRLEDGDTIKIEDYNLILNVLPGEIPVKEEPPPPPKPEPKPEPKPPEKIAEEPQEKAAEPVPQKEPEKSAVVEEKEEPAPLVSEPIMPEKKEEPPKPAPPPKPEPEKIEPAPPPKPVKEEISYMKTEEIKVEQDEPDIPEQIAEVPPPPKPAPPEPQESKPAPPPPKPEPVAEHIADETPPPPVEDNRKTKVLSTSDLPPSKPEMPSRPAQEKQVKKELDMYLLAVGGPLTGEKFKIKKGITSIGRDRKQNDIVIRNDKSGELDKSISRKHAQIEYSNGRFILSDKASQMRSMLNGKKLSQDDTLPLSVGDIVEICSIKENTVFRVAEEGNFDFSPPAKKKSIRPSLGTGNYLPYAIIAAAAVIIIILLILFLK